MTGESKPLQGCNVQALGAMRYYAIASPEFVARHFAKGMNAASLATAPMIVFNRKDDLQWRYVRRITRARLSPPIHYIPTTTGFIEAAAFGLGWCLAPRSLAGHALEAGRIVVIEPEWWLDVPLYWQHAAVRSNTLEQLSRALWQSTSTALQR